MGRKWFTGVLVAVAFGVAACGTTPATQTPTTTSAKGPGGVPSGTTAHAFGAGSDPVSGPTFPLTVRRTGGIAGFDDTVVLENDGKVLVSTRAIRGRVCTLTGSFRKQLLNLLGTLSLSPSTAVTSTQGTGASTDSGEGTSDPITISLTDHNAHPVDLSDPSLGEVAGLVGSLVSDVTLSSPATTRCTTPTSTVPAPPA